MLDSDVTRRRFMAHFAGAGLGTTLLPGALWAKMQEAGGEQITADMMSDALALAGLEFDEEEREAMLEAVNDRLSDYEELHAGAYRLQQIGHPPQLTLCTLLLVPEHELDDVA